MRQRRTAEETARQLEDAQKQIESLQKERDDQRKTLDLALEAKTSLSEANSRLTQELKSKIYTFCFLTNLG